MKNLFLYLILSMTLTSCSQKKPNNKQLNLNTQKIFEQTKRINDYSLQGHVDEDLEKIVSSIAEDAILVPPGGTDPVIGITDIRKYYMEALNAPGKSVDITTETLRFDVIDEKNATQVGSYNIKYQTEENGPTIDISGHMLIVWKKIENEWEIYLDMWH